jgi:hypothetical protein
MTGLGWRHSSMSLFKVADTKSYKVINKSVMSEIPVVFLSYDEPNADDNYEHLTKTHPNPSVIKRVHGVKGFDAAHRTAGQQFNTEVIITVDADCQVDSEFWKLAVPSETQKGLTVTWGARQLINGLMYGNGGVKLWNRNHIISMNSHENSFYEKHAVDFCWDETQYRELPGCYATTYNNSDAYRAFRVGYREGTKLTLQEGIYKKDWLRKIHPANLQRLLVWQTVGLDVKFGNWAMLGARHAVYNLINGITKVTDIRNYVWFDEYWEKEFADLNELTLSNLLFELGDELEHFYGFPCPVLEPKQSTLFKMTQLHPEKPLSYKDVRWRTNLKWQGWFNDV